MSWISFIGAIELGLAYSLVALGIFISFRILKIPDLTVDGSFVLGAVASALLTTAGYPLTALAAALVAGALAGIVTGLLQTKLGIEPILSGILTMTGLYSINLAITGGKSNLPLLKIRTVFSMAQELFGPAYYKVAVLLVLVLLVVLIYNLFFKTNLGLSIRAAGDNPVMVRASSINTDTTTLVALAIANGTVALSGGILAQLQSSADVNMGAGMVVIGLAAVIMGEIALKNTSILTGTFSVVIGAVLYRLVIAVILRTSLPPSYLKLISSIIVATALTVPTLKKRLEIKQLARRAFHAKA